MPVVNWWFLLASAAQVHLTQEEEMRWDLERQLERESRSSRSIHHRLEQVRRKVDGWPACWVLAEPRRPGIVVNFESDRLKKPLNPRATQLCSQRFFGELIEMTE